MQELRKATVYSYLLIGGTKLTARRKEQLLFLIGGDLIIQLSEFCQSIILLPKNEPLNYLS